MTLYPQVPTLLITPQICLFHVVVFLTTARKSTKSEKRKCTTCKGLVFSHNICKFVTFLLPSPLLLLKLPNDDDDDDDE